MGKFKAKKDDFFSNKDYYAGEILEGDYKNSAKTFLELKNRDGELFTPVAMDFEKVDDSTPVLYKTKEEIKLLRGKEFKREAGIQIAGIVGGLAGLGLAYKEKKKIWGYVGYFILGSIATGLIYQMVVPKKKD